MNTFTGHNGIVWNIDYSIFDDCQFICSGSKDETICVWDVGNNKLFQSFHKHLGSVNCVKFSPYHYYKYRQNVISSSSHDGTIRFWDFKDNQQLQIFKHSDHVGGIEFSQFTCGRYLCFGSYNNTINLLDVEIPKSLHVFNGHENY
ncbi:F-box and wd40 domain protein, partial [Reticulomyxa filosa]